DERALAQRRDRTPSQPCHARVQICGPEVRRLGTMCTRSVASKEDVAQLNSAPTGSQMVEDTNLSARPRLLQVSGGALAAPEAPDDPPPPSRSARPANPASAALRM